MLCQICGKEIGDQTGPCKTCLQSSGIYGFPGLKSGHHEKTTQDQNPFHLEQRARAGRSWLRASVGLVAFLLGVLIVFLWLVSPYSNYFPFAGFKSFPDAGSGSLINSTVNGAVRGLAFRQEQIVFQREENALVFRQGRGDVPDLEVSIVLPKSSVLRAGLVLEVQAGLTDTVPPLVFLKWKEPGRNVLEVAKFSSAYDYSLTLRIGEVSKDKFTGLINLRLSERLGTKFSGSFDATFQ